MWSNIVHFETLSHRLQKMRHMKKWGVRQPKEL